MIRAWHFLRDDATAPPVGEWLEHSGLLVIGRSGLNASLHPFDALSHARGDTLCLVDCDGVIVYLPNKVVCSRRRIVARMNAEPLLRYFMRQQALSVAHLWEPPQVVLDCLMGDVLCLVAARAAVEATRATAVTAARAAAWAAVWDAAAWDAAAWAAAWDAAAWAVMEATTGADTVAGALAVAEAVARVPMRAPNMAPNMAPARAAFAALVNDAFEDWI
jgi:hypothetical protein